MSTTLDEGRVGELSGQVSGLVVSPHDAGYDEARAIHNGLVDRRPALIVRCRTTADVVAALEFARSAGLEVSVRGGGHNVAGRAVTDGGVMISLADMTEVAVDPASATAVAQGGATWAELNTATGEHGLAVTGGAISTTGIAGLTLGGGLGWLMGKHGLAADNLLAVELVTAAGEVLEVDAGSHPDLFWALRGGGGNFGVVTSFTYRLHPVGMVTGGLIAHPIEAAPELLRFYRDAVADASDDLTVFAALVHAPDGSGAKLAALVVFHSGDPGEAERDLEPFKAWGSPLLVEHFHGAVTRVGATETAVPHRDEGWNVVLPSVWTDPADTEANIAWSRETFAALQPHVGRGRWLNYLGDDQAEDAIRAAYGPNYDRLREVKRQYDPDNVFHLNHNIAP